MVELTVTAVQDIPANSFLYMDYAETEYFLFKQFPCSCGSLNCRVWVTGRKEIHNAVMAQPELLHLNQARR